jgi:hypothetical protein
MTASSSSRQQEQFKRFAACGMVALRVLVLLTNSAAVVLNIFVWHSAGWAAVFAFGLGMFAHEDATLFGKWRRDRRTR